jgi:hypothetical protein
MTVKRQIHLNPIEPAQLSMRLPYLIGGKVDFSFVNQDGSPVNVDLGSTMRVVARSSGAMTEKPVISTDISNGKAQCVFDAEELTDINGYHVRLFGTVSGETQLLALGVIQPASTVGL